jgi:fumarylpyruvate hydrolase
MMSNKLAEFGGRPMNFVVPAPIVPTVPVHGAGLGDVFPVHRIYCVGRNYVDHAIEMGHSGKEAPFFFMKPADAVVPAGQGAVAQVTYPSLTQNLHHEVELVVAIGTGGSNITPENALNHVWGYAVGLDMTRRDLQNDMKKQGRPWCIGKGFEQSAPIGAITPKSQWALQEACEISLHVNGTLRQKSQLGKLIWSVPDIIAQLSAAWTLAPGDLIFTGTPEGVAAVVAGDTLTAKVDGLAPLEVKIHAA